jgi:hypothetical protein
VEGNLSKSKTIENVIDPEQEDNSSGNQLRATINASPVKLKLERSGSQAAELAVVNGRWVVKSEGLEFDSLLGYVDGESAIPYETEDIQTPARSMQEWESRKTHISQTLPRYSIIQSHGRPYLQVQRLEMLAEDVGGVLSEPFYLGEGTWQSSSSKIRLKMPDGKIIYYASHSSKGWGGSTWKREDLGDPVRESIDKGEILVVDALDFSKTEQTTKLEWHDFNAGYNISTEPKTVTIPGDRKTTTVPVILKIKRGRWRVANRHGVVFSENWGGPKNGDEALPLYVSVSPKQDKPQYELAENYLNKCFLKANNLDTLVEDLHGNLSEVYNIALRPEQGWIVKKIGVCISLESGRKLYYERSIYNNKTEDTEWYLVKKPNESEKSTI